LKNLQEATERICELFGSQVALDALVPAVIEALPPSARARLMVTFDTHAEAARTTLLHADISDVVIASFERDVARNLAFIQASLRPGLSEPPARVDMLLLSTTRVTAFAAGHVLSSASGFFYRNGDRLFLVSNRHVFSDADSGHVPDRIDIEVHTDAQDLAQRVVVSLPLYRDGLRQWREATDSAGAVDIAAIAIPAAALPSDVVLEAFDETHLQAREEVVEIGDALTIAGFPLGFHDTIHHLAVARSAFLASVYGVRFQRRGCFLTDARTHRGSSGSPVVRRRVNAPLATPATSWQLLGVHSTRMDPLTRDQTQDEPLGLNCAWYADVLTTLTQEVPQVET
jgi:hypothetical protein